MSTSIHHSCGCSIITHACCKFLFKTYIADTHFLKYKHSLWAKNEYIKGNLKNTHTHKTTKAREAGRLTSDLYSFLISLKLIPQSDP